MTNKSEAISLALEQQKKALAKKTYEYEAKIAAIESENEEFAQMSADLNMLGSQIAITALSGDSEKLAKIQKEIAQISAFRKEILTSLGVKEIEYDCPLCKDKGVVSNEYCSCIKKRAREIVIYDLSKSLPLDECTFESFDLSLYPETDENGNLPRHKMSQVLSLCKDYAESFNPKYSENLLFLGSAGLGKTHLSLSIVSTVINKGFDVIYGSAYNLFSEMENEHFVGRTNDSFSRAVSCDLLVIDDLGSEFVSPYIQSLLYNIVNTRLLAKKPIIISTNLSMAEIENRYTPRVSSRFLGSYTAKKFFGKDIRQIKAMEKLKK